MNSMDSRISAQLMAIEIVSQVMVSAEPQSLGEQLTEQLRELTGARTAMLVAHNTGTGQHEQLAVSPQRRSALFTEDKLSRFCFACTPEDIPLLVEEIPEKNPLKDCLRHAGITSVVRYPLRAGRELVGMLLLFDLPGLDRIQEIHEIMHLLAPPIALALKNSLSYRHMERQAGELERIVSERTLELQQKNAELQRAEDLHHTILQSAMEGFWLVNADFKIIDVNDAYCHMSGYDRYEMIGAPVVQFDARDSEEDVSARGASLKEFASQRFESEHRRKDGSIYSVEVSINWVPIEGGLYSVFINDITERKHSELQNARLEQQLQQAQKLESVGLLAGGVAHDFNNMLTIIMGHAELALTKVDSDDRIYENLKEISRTATKSADLTRQLLAFARKQTIEPKVLDLNTTISDMLKMLQRLIGENIHLAWLPTEELWPIYMDASQVDQILANLCVNARDAIEETGEITIRTTNTRVDSDYCALNIDASPGDYVCITVGDTGKGIEKEVLLRIFEPFYTTKEVGKGTGLGLATVYGAVKQNNGFITVHSEPGRGAVFSIYIPRYRAEPHQVVMESTVDMGKGGKERTILLVEDDHSILSVTALMLEYQGYRVVKANTPGEAIRLARENVGMIDLLMTDVVMPEMNGRELASNVLSFCPEMKKLYMSGFTADIIATHGVVEEGVNFIQKPFDLKTLVAKVREVLDR